MKKNLGTGNSKLKAKVKHHTDNVYVKLNGENQFD